MANDEFDFDDALNVKPTSAAKLVAKGIKGPLGDVVKYGADVVDTTDDGLSTTEMAIELADALGKDVETLKLDSELVKTATFYHENGDAMLNTTVEAASELAIAAVPGGTAYLAGKGVWDYLNPDPEEKPDPTGDLSVLYHFSKNKNPTAQDVMDAIKAKIHPDARQSLKEYRKDGFGADKAIDPYIGDLIGPDFKPRGGISKAEYIAQKIRNGEYEPAALVLNNPVVMPPIQRSMEEEGPELGEGQEEEVVVAASDRGKLTYSNPRNEPLYDDVGYNEPLATPRFPSVKPADPRSRTPNFKA